MYAYMYLYINMMMYTYFPSSSQIYTLPQQQQN